VRQLPLRLLSASQRSCRTASRRRLTAREFRKTRPLSISSRMSTSSTSRSTTEGGGTAADAVADAVPWHNPNDGGPRTSGVHGVRPSYGLFLRLLRDSTFDGVTLSFEQNDDRPAVVLIDCRNVSFGGELRMARGSGSGYDVGMRDSTAIAISAAGGIIACDYPHCPEPTAAPAEPPRVG